MSAYADQLWGWIAEPLRELQERCRAGRDVGWDDRLAEFLDALRLSAPDQHPLVNAVAERVKQESDPIAFVSDSGFDQIVYDLVTAQAAAQEQQPETPAQPAQPAQPEQRDPAAVADASVVAIGLPAVRALVAAQPELASGADLAGALATVVAYRLTGQAQPAGTALHTALAGYVEQQLAANPVPAGEFYALFGQDVNVAYQWVGQRVAAHAGELPSVPAAAAVTEPEPELADIGDLFDDDAGTAEPGGFADGTYLMPDLVAEFLRDVPGAGALTPDQINDAIRAVLAESQEGQS